MQGPLSLKIDSQRSGVWVITRGRLRSGQNSALMAGQPFQPLAIRLCASGCVRNISNPAGRSVSVGSTHQSVLCSSLIFSSIALRAPHPQTQISLLFFKERFFPPTGKIIISTGFASILYVQYLLYVTAAKSTFPFYAHTTLFIFLHTHVSANYICLQLPEMHQNNVITNLIYC